MLFRVPPLGGRHKLTGSWPPKGGTLNLGSREIRGVFCFPLITDRRFLMLLSVTNGSARMSKPTDLVQGTLDLLILKVVALEPMHGWAIAQRIKQISNEVLLVGQGS